MSEWKKWFNFVKPDAATAEFWDRWQRMTKARWPKLYFFRERIPVIIAVKKRQFNDGIWWIRYRTTDRNHILPITDLKPGYYEVDTKMLYASFALLREHVEIGLAHRNYDWYRQRIPKWVPKMLRRHWPRKICPEAGLDHLRWEMTDEDILTNNPEHAETAATILRLYTWWTVERHERIDQHEDKRIWEGVVRPEGFLANGSPSYRAALDSMSKTEDFYTNQDQAMLMKLVGLRRWLWS